MKVGSHYRISPQAWADWRRAREAEAAAEPGIHPDRQPKKNYAQASHGLGTANGEDRRARPRLEIAVGPGAKSEIGKFGRGIPGRTAADDVRRSVIGSLRADGLAALCEKEGV